MLSGISGEFVALPGQACEESSPCSRASGDSSASSWRIVASGICAVENIARERDRRIAECVFTEKKQVVDVINVTVVFSQLYFLVIPTRKQ